MKVKLLVISALAVAALSLMVGKAAFAKQTGDARPGCGWGDVNHVHTCPGAGPSTNPIP
jgi:hypothetical protein